MNSETHGQAKQLIASSHDIAYSAKLVQHDLLLLIEGTQQLKDVDINIKEIADSVIIELEKTRSVMAEAIATANDLYHAGLDAMKEGGL